MNGQSGKQLSGINIPVSILVRGRAGNKEEDCCCGCGWLFG